MTKTTRGSGTKVRHLVAAFGACLLLACGGGDDEAADGAASQAPPRAQTRQGTEDGGTVRAAMPIEGHMRADPAWLERERMDPAWRAAADSDRQTRRSRTASATEGAGRSAEAGRSGERAATAAGAQAPIERMRAMLGRGTAAGASDRAAEPAGSTPAGESWESLSPDVFAGFTPTLPVPQEGGGPSVLALQWMLDHVAFSPGVIDGRWGKNTEKAVYWLQDSLGLEATGQADRRLWDLLSGQVGSDGPLREHMVSSGDLEGPFVDIPEEPQAQAELDCMCHPSPREALAERFHTTPELLERLNPDVDLAAISAGTRLWVPAVAEVAPEAGLPDRVARIVVSKDGFYLHALDEAGGILYHFPTTVGATYNPSPTGELEVTGIAYRPTYHYQPSILDDVPDDEADAVLPPGPNSPVGLVWMQLSEDTYGIHGTSAPATIGYATSHGCVRLTNWDALFLANRTAQGTPVEFTGGSGSGG